MRQMFSDSIWHRSRKKKKRRKRKKKRKNYWNKESNRRVGNLGWRRRSKIRRKSEKVGFRIIS